MCVSTLKSNLALSSKLMLSHQDRCYSREGLLKNWCSCSSLASLVHHSRCHYLTLPLLRSRVCDIEVACVDLSYKRRRHRRRKKRGEKCASNKKKKKRNFTQSYVLFFKIQIIYHFEYLQWIIYTIIFTRIIRKLNL